MTSLRKVCLILFLSSSSEAFTMTPVNSNNRSTITQLAITTGDNDSSESSVIDSRRTVLRKAAFAAASLVAFSPVLGANALDMEAFANAQVSIKLMGRLMTRKRKKSHPTRLYLIFCFAYNIILFLSFFPFTIFRSNRMLKIVTPKMIQDAYRY